MTAVQVRANSPGGRLVASTGPSGSVSERKLRSRTVFYLQNVSNGRPLTAANTLSTVTVDVACSR